MTYENSDLAVVPPSQRTWGVGNYVSLWISMSLCIPTYMLASSLIEGGMNWWQALLTVLLGNGIVLIPMLLNGHAGARYGIPFPVFCRASFGVRGANLPALARAIVACGWFGIQTWIGGHALYQLFQVWWPSLDHLPAIFPSFLGLATGPGLCFLLFLGVNLWVISRGIESIRRLLIFKAWVLPLVAMALLLWAVLSIGGLGPIFSRPSKFQTVGEFWSFFVPSLTAMVGFWATLSLNIPDFTRYARDQRSHFLGQSISLPLSMTAFSFVGVAVTSATILLYGDPIWDPIALVGKFSSKGLVSVGLLAVVLSTLATNIAANIVSPANDFSHLWPVRIDFKRGGYLTGVIGALILPWKLIASPTGYIFTWLIGYSGMLGAIGGILITDYFLLRRGELQVAGLYRQDGPYWYHRGFNPNALIAFFLGILPALPGFIKTLGLVTTMPEWLMQVYHYAWFVSFAVSSLIYWALPRRA